MQLGRFGEIMDCVQHLIDETGSILPKEFCDDCRKQLKTLAFSECAVCCGFVYSSEFNTVYGTNLQYSSYNKLNIHNY